MNNYCPEDSYPDTSETTELYLFLLVLQVFLEVVLARRMLLLRTVERRPYRLSLEKTHSMAEMPFVTGKAMINTFWQGYEITLLHVDPHPLIIQITHIEVPRSTQNVSNFFCIVDMLCKSRENEMMQNIMRNKSK